MIHPSDPGCEPEDDSVCPDCLPGSMCMACLDDLRFHEERDRKCEEGR